MTSLGNRLKLLRKQNGARLQQVSKAIGVSVSFLSQLENDKVGASFSTLVKLAQFHGIHLAELLEDVDTQGNPIISRADSRKPTITGNRFTLEWLVNNSACAMGVDILTIAPGGGSGETYTHAGEEFAYVVTGNCVITVGTEEHRLSEGDLLYFKSTLEHSWRNESEQITRVLFCTTPPTI